MQNHRRLRTSSAAFALAALVSAFLATGCSLQDHVCRSEEYPVKAVGSTTGQACAADGEDPPKGYVRYPEGKVPEYVGDKWDEYWSTRVIDEDGRVTEEDGAEKSEK